MMEPELRTLNDVRAGLVRMYEARGRDRGFTEHELRRYRSLLDLEHRLILQRNGGA